MSIDMIEIERIMNTYGDDILRIGFLYLHDRHMAEDVLQETMIIIYKKYHTLNQAACEKTWIFSIAINVCKNYKRTAWFRKVILSDKFKDDFISAQKENLLDTHEDDYKLLHEIMNLRPIYKDVILLYYYQQFKTTEIAQMLNKSESTVTVRLSRARKQLKKKIEGWE